MYFYNLDVGIALSLCSSGWCEPNARFTDNINGIDPHNKFTNDPENRVHFLSLTL